MTRVSIQTKILGLVISLVIAIIVSLVGIFLYVNINETYEKSNKVGLQTAKMISFIPVVQNALENDHLPSIELQPLVEQIRNNVDANFIVIENRDGELLTHPDTEMIGTQIPVDDSFKANVFGGYYSIQSDEIIGPSLVGKAPIFNDQDQVIGVVSVGYLLEDIHSDIFSTMKRISYFSTVIILIGVIASIFLARNIRKDTFGLEPREIAALYRDRRAILSSILEGVIAVDDQGKITVINSAARRILGLKKDDVNKPIQKVIPDSDFLEAVEKKQKMFNEEMTLQGRVIILQLVPIIENKKVVGAVATFRDKTEMREMINALSEIRKYSEDLRAQTHEFTNKLYAISGLLQLGHYKDALDIVQEEIETNETNSRILFEQIKDPKVQAILLGKMGKASEKKITFEVDENSSLNTLPQHIETSQLIVIIGNLIDNAFDEVAAQQERKVSFFALDYGEDIIFEVTDNGGGITDEALDMIFEQGYSTKQESRRGYGLANVKEAVHELHGMIQVDSGKGGTTFSVYLPKKVKS